MKSLLWGIVLVLVGLMACQVAMADTALVRDLPPGLQIPDAARPGPAFDVDKATEAYLNLLSPEQRAKSDAYFEGGYWLQLWQLLYGLAVAGLLLFSGISTRMRNLARRISSRPWWTTFFYVIFWLIVGGLLSLPMTIYADFFREHQYGLATQNFTDWSFDQLKELMVSLVIAPLILSLLYVGIRRTGARWWIWASGGAFVFILFFAMIFPVVFAPIFNDYKPLREGPVRESVLSLARANMVPTTNVVEFDASKQTTRISANVSGFLNTTRISLNDNLLDKTSTPEIHAVLGHEMGHYVLNHSLRGVIYLVLVLTLGLFVVHVVFDRLLMRWGPRLGLEGRADPAALPLALGILSVFFFFATPLTNSITRQSEAEADAFGLNAAREPNGFAMAAMRLSTYRKIKPGALEEIIFYDHPSGYARVHRSMTWLAENQDNPTANAPIVAVRQ